MKTTLQKDMIITVSRKPSDTILQMSLWELVRSHLKITEITPTEPLLIVAKVELAGEDFVFEIAPPAKR